RCRAASRAGCHRGRRSFPTRRSSDLTPADPEGWWREPPHRNDVAKGIAAVRLIQLRAGEIRPGVARCHDCLLETGEIHEIEWMPGARIEGQRCMNHAAAAGRRYVEQRLLERVR